MAGIARDFSNMGRRGHSVSTGILRGGCDTRIRRPLWRNNSSAPDAFFLCATSGAQIRAVERADDRARDGRPPVTKVAAALSVSRNVSREVLCAFFGGVGA